MNVYGRVNAAEIMNTGLVMVEATWSVYLAVNKELNYWKIGISTNPKNRMMTLSLPFVVTLVDAVPIGIQGEAREAEKLLHKRFKHLRLRSEWFRDIDPLTFRTESIAMIPQAKENYKISLIPTDEYLQRAQARRDKQWARTQAYLRQGEEERRRQKKTEGGHNARFNDSLT
jgi:hypothetical protein